ncbi:PH domain-containing protein [Blastococcus sp. TML/M2B]|uniref:PH domain-containing protein n=1 Tax=unclassified Blastococcus TaxID=2619396 RepID=UPI00190DC151|nr:MULTISPECIES: PH domain-containing protein [unclassified Blastococcus]MBN1092598.1 PH domain-containing protein [Blastococcus sp. TML/M2B]MBN1097310.1 PH domain-containing protein [Blastococcus sp. TML/C7B]
MSGPTTATPAAVSAVPRRLRLLLAVLAGAVLVVAAVVVLTLPSTTNTVVEYGVVDQVALAGLGVLLAAGVLLLGRSRVDADASGVRVRNLFVQHVLPWQAVRAVRFERKSAWGSLALENGDEVSVWGLQAADGEYAVRAVEGMRALHAAARATDPVPPPLLYDN